MISKNTILGESKSTGLDKMGQIQYQGIKSWAKFLEDYSEVFSKISNPEIKEKLLGKPFTVNIVTFPDGLYEGEIKYGQMECIGMLVWYSRKTYFFGQWQNDEFHYIGIRYCFRTGKIFEGDFVNNRPSGVGRMTCRSSCKSDLCVKIYEGEFKDGELHGHGKVTYFCEHTPKLEYEGEWINGAIHGQGTGAYKSGSKYIGHFKDGMHHGKGKYYLDDVLCYEGDFQNSLPHGKGKKYGRYGLKYEGELVEGNYEGFGSYYFEDGSKYVGGFKDNKYHGIGTLSTSDGIVWDGYWFKGTLYFRNDENTENAVEI